MRTEQAVPLSLLGSRIDVRTSVAAVAAVVRQLWGACLEEGLARTAAGVVDVRRRGSMLVVSSDLVDSGGPGDLPADLPAEAPDWASAIGLLSSALNRRAVRRCPYFAVHAGVVAHDGAAVAFPADSGVGKTTLVAACLRRGMGYVSDEALALTDSGTVVPYRRPLAMSRWTARTLGLEPAALDVGPEVMLAPAEVGGRALTEDQPRLRHLVSLERGSALPVALVELHRGAAPALLMRSSFNHYRRPESHLRLAAHAARSLRLWRLTYTDPHEAAAAIGELVGLTSP